MSGEKEETALGREGNEAPMKQERKEMEPILRIDNMRTEFRTDDGIVKAVRGVSYDVAPGEVLGIVGESGSGKSVSMLSLLRLLPKTATVSADSLEFMGEDLLGMKTRDLRKIEGKNIGMIFQDPMTSLNPVFTIGMQVMEPLKIHRNLRGKEAEQEAIRMLEAVGIPDPVKRMKQYPFEFSGGMRQRVMIAIAMACNPPLLIADEPTTALDVTIQAQILELMRSICNERGTSIVLITHDLGVIAGMCDRVIVMYGGLIMEEAPVDELFYHAAHPYTQGLISSLPDSRIKNERLKSIPGSPPDLLNPPVGCPFLARCDHAMVGCSREMPELVDLGNGHRAACYLRYAEATPQ